MGLASRPLGVEDEEVAQVNRLLSWLQGSWLSSCRIGSFAAALINPKRTAAPNNVLLFWPLLQEPLPAPMTPGNYERRASACLLQRAFEKVVVQQQGFEW